VAKSNPNDLPAMATKAGKAAKAKHEIRKARAAAHAAARDLRRAVVSGVGALASIAVGSAFGDIHGHGLRPRLMALGAAGVFLLLAQFSIRYAANGLAKVVGATGGRAAGVALRLVTLVVGYLFMALILLGMLDVPVGHLLLGGAVTGVIVGIAAQQSLSNVVAGMVLLMTRVFRVGDRVRMRSGPLGGEINGVITGMGLSYVVVETEDGRLHVPNSAVLSAAVGPNLAAKREPSPAEQHHASTAHMPDRGVSGDRPAETPASLKNP
jgi:small-conductance mechanosensitive channel